MELREHKSSFIVYFTLRLLVIVMMVLQLMNRNYENVFLCVLTLMLLVIPSLVQVTFKVELPTVRKLLYSFLYLPRRSWGKSVNFICCFLFGILGAAYDQRIPCGGYRFFPCGSAEQKQKGSVPVVASLRRSWLSVSTDIGVIWELSLNSRMESDRRIRHAERYRYPSPSGLPIGIRRDETLPYESTASQVRAVNGGEAGDWRGHLHIGTDLTPLQDLIVNLSGLRFFGNGFSCEKPGRGKVAKRFIHGEIGA